MATPSAYPGTEPLPDYHELTSPQQAHRHRLEQHSKDTFELRTVKRKLYLCSIFCSYAALAVTSWVILCHIGRGRIYHGYRDEIRHFRDPSNGPRDLKVASVIASIASVLALPTTAAICACAAVPFTQYHAGHPNLTLRQTLALANRDWMSPFAVIALLSPKRNRTHGSRFLWFAVFITLLGLAIWPIQQGFLAQVSTTKVAPSDMPSWSSITVTDIPLLADGIYENQGVVRLRKAMESWNPKDCSPRFWWNNATGDTEEWQQLCAKSQSGSIYNTFADVLQNDGDYFVAQLPYGYNTGVGRNHVPRFNTSVQYDMVSVDDVPEGCFSDEENAGFIKYKYDSFEETYPGYNRSFHVRTCISNDALRSPLIKTRNRQDFDEAFYLNISVSGWSYSTTPDETIFKASARTTVGYFELPNYYNHARHGPILDEFEITDSRLLDDYASSSTSQYNDNDDGAELPTALEQVANKGPLASMYVALFGNGSFLHASASPEYLTYLNSTVGDQARQCADFIPLGRIYGTVRGSGYGSVPGLTCIQPSLYPGTLRLWAADWLASFLDVKRARAALRISAFLANEITLANPDGRGGIYLQVEPGVDVLAPVVPLAGLIVGSALLGFFLLVLLGLVLFALSTPRWTDRLDATATMRMGAAMALSTDGLARLVGGEKVLDKAPGFVGDAMQDKDVGRLAVGAEGLLKRPGRYENALCGVMPE